MPEALRALLEEGAGIFAPYFKAPKEVVGRGIAEWLLNYRHCWRDGRLDRTSVVLAARLKGSTLEGRLFGRISTFSQRVVRVAVR